MKTNLPIVLYNFFHNGDLFHSKAFVKEITENISVPVYYAHGWHSDKVVATNNSYLVNTWIGAYFKSNISELKGEPCTLKFNYDMYKYLYSQINEIYGSNLKLNSNILNYFPTVDPSKFNISKIEEYLSKDKNKKILFSNGPAMSNQTSYNNSNLQTSIENLALTYKNISFICTSKFNTSISNILFTSDIIQEKDCDLSEISYLSRFCDIIIGRSSGPYCFSCTKENMLDFNKTFICFGDRITDCFQYETDTNSKFVFEQFNSEESLIKVIKNVING